MRPDASRCVMLHKTRLVNTSMRGMFTGATHLHMHEIRGLIQIQESIFEHKTYDSIAYNLDVNIDGKEY